MLVRKCDKCGKEINGNYWTIDIYETEDEYGYHTSEGAANNIKQNWNRSKEYCYECVQDFKKYLQPNKEN